jgi:hypothetical protein
MIQRVTDNSFYTLCRGWKVLFLGTALFILDWLCMAFADIVVSYAENAAGFFGISSAQTGGMKAIEERKRGER